jgi:acyl-coenzyme A thioesterase PaaI-like protein
VSFERARLIAFRLATPYVGFLGNTSLPALHGGVLAGFLELTALMTLAAVAPSGRAATVDFTIEYLRSAGPRDTLGKATIKRRGRRFANVDAVAWQDDPAKPVAAISGRFSV